MKLLQQIIMESPPTWKLLSADEADKFEVYGGRIGTLKATYAEIVQTIGEPTYVSRGKGAETKATWVIEGSNGVIASIYDYKSNADYNDSWDVPMDMRGMTDDPVMQAKIKDRMKKKMAELKKDPAYRLGLHNVKEWSISGSFDSAIAFHTARVNKRAKPGREPDFSLDRKPASPVLDLVHAAFGDRVHDTAYGLEFERIMGKDPEPYVPSHLRNKR